MTITLYKTETAAFKVVAERNTPFLWTDYTFINKANNKKIELSCIDYDEKTKKAIDDPFESLQHLSAREFDERVQALFVV